MCGCVCVLRYCTQLSHPLTPVHQSQTTGQTDRQYSFTTVGVFILRCRPSSAFDRIVKLGLSSFIYYCFYLLDCSSSQHFRFLHATPTLHPPWPWEIVLKRPWKPVFSVNYSTSLPSVIWFLVFFFVFCAYICDTTKITFIFIEKKNRFIYTMLSLKNKIPNFVQIVKLLWLRLFSVLLLHANNCFLWVLIIYPGPSAWI